ncbi:MAG: 50S ribosomal protein L24 [Candidatus Pelagibacter sp.]|nr:50S ribosomal protein L24 [Candidatus Pelagibacter sp.]OUW11801.1 MAG: 50S ribosomal protein L24 [Candidatus Pelagibacter sp. TMED166]|tara:strand:+ start:11382 stop:11693 length:312 start_codon:yes stop_codon:yes gene_type:complete
MIKIKIKKGNTVKILSGNDRGKSGEVIKLFPKNFSAIIKGMNLKKKHQKPTKEKKGGIITMEKPINISNLVLENNKIKPTVKIDKKIKDKKKTTKQKTKSKKK